MRFAFLTVSMLVLLCMSCSGNSAPTTPDYQEADLPSWTFNIDGQEYVAGPGDLLNDRQLAEVVDPGTDMTPDELRVYFAVNITGETFPGFIQCTVYKFYMYPMMETIPDQGILAWVVVMEAQGYDVPNGPPPDPIC